MFNLKCLLPDTSVGHFVFFLRLIAACFEAEKIKYFLRRLSVSFFLSTDVSRNFQVCRNTFSFCLPPLSLSLRLRLSSVSMSVNFRECSLIVSVLCKFFNDDFLHECYQTAGPIFATRQQDKFSLVFFVDISVLCKNDEDLRPFDIL